MNFWAKYWLVWFFGGFLVPEAFWAFVNAKYTVTQETYAFEDMNARHPLDVADWTPVHWIFGVVMVVFWMWLFGHLVLGQPANPLHWWHRI